MADVLQIRSLAGEDPDVLTRVFNEAFADYVIQFQATREFKEFRWRLARVDWELSLGAFDGERLVGFCYHGMDEVAGHREAYNSGTGVIPAYRGRRLVDRIYEASWPRFRMKGIQRATLEVIAGNDRAVRVYERIGFERERELAYLKGELDAASLRRRAAQVAVRELRDPPWEELARLEETRPAWDFMLSGARVQGAQVRVFGAHHEGRLVGAAILRPSDQTLCWLAVAPDVRRRGVAAALMLPAARHSSTWRMVNVDRGAAHLMAFLEWMGLREEMYQHEMAIAVPEA